MVYEFEQIQYIIKYTKLSDPKNCHKNVTTNKNMNMSINIFYQSKHTKINKTKLIPLPSLIFKILSRTQTKTRLPASRQ